MDTKQKYVRLPDYDEIVIFPCVIQHSEFRHFKPVSAGFCYVNPSTKTVQCFGESVSLGISNSESDTFTATRQVFGWDEAQKLL